MPPSMPAELVALGEQLDANERDAQTLIAGLSDDRGGWRARPGSWSVAECLEHLANADREYVAAMRAPAQRAREQGRLHRRPAVPGLIGRWFVGILEPPVKAGRRAKAPKVIQPRPSPPLAEAAAAFLAAHRGARAFLDEVADLDLASVRFPNPFISGIRFSLATGLHVIAAHERRHLWQAWNVRRGAEA